MTIPKKKYRDKVRERLALVRSMLLSDMDRTKEMMKRVGGFDEFGSDLHNRLEAITILLDRDMPALLDALDGIRGE